MTDVALMEPEILARRCVAICEERKAQDLLLYDVTAESLLTDYQLICSGSSEPHLRALSSHLQKDLADEGVRPLHVDGSPASRWIVLDYGTVLIHILHPELRHYYRLEELWGDDCITYRGSENDG